MSQQPLISAHKPVKKKAHQFHFPYTIHSVIDFPEFFVVIIVNTGDLMLSFLFPFHFVM
jgi:hypothetical protein